MAPSGVRGCSRLGRDSRGRGQRAQMDGHLQAIAALVAAAGGFLGMMITAFRSGHGRRTLSRSPLDVRVTELESRVKALENERPR